MRIERLMRSDDPELAGLAAKIDREEVYHRMHAEMWADRLRGEPRFRGAVEELWPYALGVLARSCARRLAERVGLPSTGTRRSSAASTRDELARAVGRDDDACAARLPGGAQW